jgi:hypothetical protein
MGNTSVIKKSRRSSVWRRIASFFSVLSLGFSPIALGLNGNADSTGGDFNNRIYQPSSFAESEFTQAIRLTFGLTPEYERLEISPVFAQAYPASLALLQSQSDFHDLAQGRIDISSFLKQKVMDSFGDLPLGVIERVESNGGKDTATYQYSVGSTPLCQFKVRFHRFRNGDVTAMGLVPRIDHRAFINQFGNEDWPDLFGAMDKVRELVERQEGGIVSDTPLNPERCYYVYEGKLIPAWKFLVQRHSSPDALRALSTDSVIASDTQIFKRESFDFDVTGKVRVYPFNSVKTPTVTQETIENLTGDGTLTSDILMSAVSPPFTRVQAKDHDFSFSPDTTEFGEVSAFTHATKHLKYLMANGFEWYGLKPLKISVFVSALKNNARFVPQIGDNTPGQIDVGTSDGKILSNLELDSDVVSHEVGHFVIYRSVRSTSGESLVLHEGLADYFAFARSNDACLGESICPLDSGACIKPGQCLRSGETNLKFNDESWKLWFDIRKSLNHLHGQIISGLLWDLRDKQISAQALDQIVMASINLLPEDADFSHFLLALASADRSLFGGVNYVKFQKAAQDRNLGNRFPSTGSNGGLAKSVVTESQVTKDQLSGQTNNPSDESQTQGASTTNRRSSGGVPCGVVGNGSHWKLSNNYGFLFVILMPLVTLLLPKKNALKSLARIRSRSVRKYF